MQVTHTLRRAVQLYRNQPAILDGETRMTWKEQGERIPRLAGALQSLGIGDDDKVAILMLNGYRYFELFYGTLWAGGVMVPLNIRLAPPEIIYQINESDATVLVVDDTFAAMLPAMAGKTPNLKHVIFASPNPPPEGCLSYDNLVASSDPVPDAERDGEDTAGIFYTGGTTGRPKGVMLTHDNLMANSMNGLLANRATKDDVYLHVAPMFHLADCSSTWGLTMVGATHAFIPGFDPVAMMKAMQGYRVTLGLMIPTMLNMIINHPQFEEFDLSSIRCVLYGASPIPTAVLKKALKVLPADYVQGYGMTELSPLVTMLPPEDHVIDGTPQQLMRLKSAGFSLFTAEVRVMDENDSELPLGEIGEICARGPMVMKGYWKQPEATAEAKRNGWMHTGDAGYMDEDGYVYLVDRTKDMIVSGGENVYSVEVEAALHEHEGVLEAAVIGIPHEEWGEAVHAVVVLRPGAQIVEEELIVHCHERIANYKCPKSISFVEDQLPKSGAGKILKRDLREPYWANRERRIN